MGVKAAGQSQADLVVSDRSLSDFLHFPHLLALPPPPPNLKAQKTVNPKANTDSLSLAFMAVVICLRHRETDRQTQASQDLAKREKELLVTSDLPRV